ncbi:hypothetical protein [Meiothermus sp. CFH 77666]|uniref:tetratricopeptide repeat protein n=1 Tax=Meiothermus sp. CFH 77666 TaxID=2817942 RepID=UPI001AA0A34A|nr:hypothetical protein [Meiothermus sp. CFH 77666]MBO1438668.1 hypothetical protein [Meiothermus sp. CFH 77666]
MRASWPVGTRFLIEIAGSKSTWQLGHELDLDQRVMSLESPLASVLLTTLPEEPFSFKGPRGIVEGRLVSVEHPDGAEGLEEVLGGIRFLRNIQARVSAKQVLGQEEKAHLNSLGEYGLLAEALEIEFAATRDTLAAVMASSNWRKAGNPLKALRVTEGVEDRDPVRMSMLLTTRGAALLDIGDLDGAELWAQRAIALTPSSHYPRNLLAKVMMSRGQIGEGMLAFEQAQRLESGRMFDWED